MAHISSRTVYGLVTDFNKAANTIAANAMLDIAQQRDKLSESFARGSEIALATVEQLRERKSTSKADMRRAELIANDMVDVLRTWVSIEAADLRHLPRLRQILEKQ